MDEPPLFTTTMAAGASLSQHLFLFFFFLVAFLACIALHCSERVCGFCIIGLAHGLARLG